MKITRILTGIAVALAMIAAHTQLTLAADADTANCKFVYQAPLGKGFTVTSKTVSTNVVVEGNETCRMNFTLASFKIPHDTLTPYPVEEQTLFDHTVLRNVGPGTYKMTVKIPNCFWQIDLVRGTTPTGPNGQLPFEPNRMLNSTLGGKQKCVEKPVAPNPPEEPKTPTTPDPTPPVPETPAPVTSAGTTSTTPTVLPKAGAGSVAASAMGVATLSGALYHQVFRRRNR